MAAVLKRNLVWRALRVPFWIFCHVWIRLKTYGIEHIDNTKGGLLLLNHQSFLDPMLVAVLLERPVSFLARDSLFRLPVVGWILRNTYVMPISRESVRGSSIRVALERLEAGFLVGIFPEGTRSETDQVQDFRPGFLAIARRTDQPIYPVAVSGAGEAMPRGAILIRPKVIRVVIGPALTAEETELIRTGTDDRQLAELARSKVAACHAEARSHRGLLPIATATTNN